MVDMTTDETIDDIHVTVGIEDGNGRIRDQVTAGLRVQTPELQPLSEREPHVTLRVKSNGVRAVVDLDGQVLDELAEAVQAAQERDE